MKISEYWNKKKSSIFCHEFNSGGYVPNHCSLRKSVTFSLKRALFISLWFSKCLAFPIKIWIYADLWHRSKLFSTKSIKLLQVQYFMRYRGYQLWQCMTWASYGITHKIKGVITYPCYKSHFDGLVQERRNSSALARTHRLNLCQWQCPLVGCAVHTSLDWEELPLILFGSTVNRL